MEPLVFGVLAALVALGIFSRLRRGKGRDGKSPDPARPDMGRSREVLEADAPPTAARLAAEEAEESAQPFDNSTPRELQDEARTPETSDLVVVFESYDTAQVLIARSLLEAAEIPFMVTNDAIQDLFGVGRLGMGNLAAGPVMIRVPAEYAERTQILFEDLED